MTIHGVLCAVLVSHDIEEIQNATSTSVNLTPHCIKYLLVLIEKIYIKNWQHSLWKCIQSMKPLNSALKQRRYNVSF